MKYARVLYNIVYTSKKIHKNMLHSTHCNQILDVFRYNDVYELWRRLRVMIDNSLVATSFQTLQSYISLCKAMISHKQRPDSFQISRFEIINNEIATYGRHSIKTYLETLDPKTIKFKLSLLSYPDNQFRIWILSVSFVEK